MTSTSRTDDFIPDEPFVLIFIGMDIGSDFSIKYPADVYAAVHGYWRMNPGELVNSPGFLVLARSATRVLGAYRVKTWVPSPRPDDEGRWGFVGEPAELSAQLRYVGKRVPDRYRPLGERNPIRFVAPDTDDS